MTDSNVISGDVLGRRVRLELVDLGLPSPARLDSAIARQSRWQSDASLGPLRVRAAETRRRLVLDLAHGTRSLNEGAVNEWARVGRFVTAPGDPSDADDLAREVLAECARDVGTALAATAGQVFDTIATEARAAIAALAQLPDPPDRIWTSPEPTQQLAVIREHEPTPGILIRSDTRFWAPRPHRRRRPRPRRLLLRRLPQRRATRLRHLPQLAPIPRTRT